MRRLQRQLAVICLLMAIGPGTSFSQEKIQGDGVAYISGNADCGMWLKARSEGRAAALEHYLVGFLDGMVMGMIIEFWRIGDDTISRDQVFFWMDKFCRDKPLGKVSWGAWRLFGERGHEQIEKRLKRDAEQLR